MSKWYGNLTNRIEEGHNYSNKDLEVGTDITMYYWSDRHCYFITKVIDQKHIFVKKYHVCADRDAGAMSNVWKYFKTEKEMNQYLNSFHIKDLQGNEIHYNENPIESTEEEWCFRYGHWNTVSRYNLDTYKKALELAKKDCSHPEDEECVKRVARYFFRVTDEELEKVLAGKEVVKYNRITNGISFGVKDYYYDYEF